MPYKDPEKYRECSRVAQRKYRAANPEKSRAATKRWQEKNKDKVSAKFKAYIAEWKKEDLPGYQEYLRNKHLLAKFGITSEQWDVIWKLQNETCAICKGNKQLGRGKPHTDHGNNMIRGILCHSCNVGLGQFQHNPELLRRAADYLEGKTTTFIPINFNGLKRRTTN